MNNWEQKYKDLIARLQKAKENDDVCDERYCCVIDEIAPELKESEDGESKKWILEYLYDGLRKSDEQFKGQFKATITWLEKQGEQKVSYTTLVETGNGGINALVTKELPTNGCDDGQKPTDKVEPKFKVGDWIVWQNKCYKVNYNGCGYELIDQNGLITSLEYGTVDKSAHLWIIKNDAKDGDVLVDICDDFANPLIFILKKFEHKDFGLAKLSDYSSYCYLTMSNSQNFKEGSYHHMHNIHPATKEQRDLLFKKMKDAGYEWDAEKKELKKIEDEEYDGEDYGIDSLYHAQRILEKTLGSVDGYQTDDGILAHKCAITAVKKLYEQKSNWSEEDEKLTNRIEGWLDTLCDYLKDSSPECIEDVKDIVEQLKSLKDRYTWKPSKGQLECLDVAIDKVDKDHSPFFTNRAYLTLKALKKQLEQL